MKKNILKKLVGLGLTGVMTTAMAATAMAANYDEAPLTLTNKGSAYCYIYVGADNASADTSVYTNYSTANIYAYAEVSLTLTYANGYESSAGSDWDSETVIGSSAYAEAYVTASSDYSVGAIATSSHVAEIDGVSESCGLEVEY